MSLPLQVAFITGQSDPTNCALSPSQERFLDALPVPEAARVRCNFPYAPTRRPHRDVSLATASWNNFRQFLTSRRPEFAARYSERVTELILRAERTVLLAGSAGLELLTNLALAGPMLERVHVFAYGAVARRRPAVDHLAVIGRRDWIARPWRRHGDVVVDGHHLSYLEMPDVLAHCTDLIARVSRL